MTPSDIDRERIVIIYKSSLAVRPLRKRGARGAR